MSEPAELSVPAVLRQVRASLPDLAARVIFRLDRVVSASGDSGHVAYLPGDGARSATYAQAAWLPDGAAAISLIGVCVECGALGHSEDVPCASCDGSGWVARAIDAASDPRPLTVAKTSRFLEPADDTSLALHHGENPLDRDCTVRVRLDLVIRGLGPVIPQPLSTVTDASALTDAVRERIERWQPRSGLFVDERSPLHILEGEWKGREGEAADAFARACGELLDDADPRIVSAGIHFFGLSVEIPDDGALRRAIHGDLRRWEGVDDPWSNQGWDMRAALVRGAAARIENPTPADVAIIQREFSRPQGVRAVIAILSKLTPAFVVSALPGMLPQEKKLLDTVVRLVSFGALPVEGTIDACVKGLGSQVTREAMERILKGDRRAVALAHLASL
jgi:hypothetical protein